MPTCDRCPARAHVQIRYDSGASLYACHHHEREWFPEDGTYEGVEFIYQTVTL